MYRKLLSMLFAVCISTSAWTFTDSLWIIGSAGYPGDLVAVEVWVQYEGAGLGDSMSASTILLTWDATICTMEAITIGPDFAAWEDWWHEDFYIIDNESTHYSPAVPKIAVFPFTFGPPIGPPFLPRGTYLAGTIDMRIMSAVIPPDSTYIDTLMQAYPPSVYLGFGDKMGIHEYVPGFSGNCVRVSEYACGDCNGDGTINFADALYLKNHYYQTPPGSPSPIGQGDVNLDGKITFADALYIKNYYYQTPPGSPPPCEPPLSAPSFGETRMER